MTIDNQPVASHPAAPPVSLSTVRNKFASLPPVLWVAFGYLMLTSLFTFPLLFNFGHGLPGTLIEDRNQNLWNLWWVKEALLHFRNPFRTDFIYQPEAISLYFYTLHPLNGFLSLPVQLLFGPLAGYDFTVFFSFIMAGVGSWLLLEYLCANGWAAFAASLIFVFSAYHLYTLVGLMQLISLEWLPFYILFCLKTVRAPQNRIRNAGLAAFFLVCIALTDWYYTVFVLGFTLFYAFWLAAGRLWQRYRRPLPTANTGQSDLRMLGLILLLFGLAMSPVLWPMLRELNTTSYYLPDPNDLQKYAPDLFSFLVPPLKANLLGGLTQNLPVALRHEVYLGYLALVLALLGAFVNRASRMWLILSGLYWLLACGPTLKINGLDTGFPMPYALIQNWPVLKIMRSPDRFIVITMLGLAICAAFGLTWLFGQLSARTGQRDWLLAAVTVLCLTLELLQIPLAVNDYRVSPFLEKLGQDPSDYAILNLPGQSADWTGAERMAEQTFHHKRIFDGYLSREYPHPFENQAPAFRELTTLKFNQDISVPSGSETLQDLWNSALSFYRVRYIVLDLPRNAKQTQHTDLNAYRAAIQKIAPGQPVYQDQTIEVYRVPAIAQPRPFIQIGDGWLEPEPNSPTPDTLYHRWAAGPANLDLLWQGPNPITTRLIFKMGVLKDPFPATIKLDGVPVWTGPLGTTQDIPLDLKLASGTHHLTFEIAGQPASPKTLGLGSDPRKLLFYLTGVSLEPVG